MDTLRENRQKMVDTALVSDLLSFTRSESRNFGKDSSSRPIAIVVGDDDDLLPGAFTAEMWGIRLAVLRINRDAESVRLKTAGIVYNL